MTNASLGLRRQLFVASLLLLQSRLGASGSNGFRQLTRGSSHTINDLCYLAIDSFHLLVDHGHSIINASHSIVDTMSGLQQLRRSHPSLLLRQPIQPV